MGELFLFIEGVYWVRIRVGIEDLYDIESS